MAAPPSGPYTIGVLSLQGAFLEHISFIEDLQLAETRPLVTLNVRTKEDLGQCGEWEASHRFSLSL